MALAEDYGQDAPAATAVSPDQELTQLRNEHRRLLEENGKRRAELLGMLREDSKRLHNDNREMEAFRQWLIDIRPRDVPVALDRKVEEYAKMAEMTRLADATEVWRR